jgi:hypothetical protein
LKSDGTIKDASEIVWYNDKDDDMPIATSSTVQTGKFPFGSPPSHILKAHQHEITEHGTLHGCREPSKLNKKTMNQTCIHSAAKGKIASESVMFYLTLKTSHIPQLCPWCKGNPNSLREQLSLKTNQGESKVNI